MTRGLATLTLLLTLVGCSNLVPFTDNLRKQYGIDDDAALRLQFYLDGDILLEREISTPQSAVKHGKIVSRAGKVVNQVAVEDHTAGVALVASTSTLGVSFDATSNSTLKFAEDQSSRDPGGVYHYDKYYYFSQGAGSIVTYDGEVYSVVAGKITHPPFLLVDLDKLASAQRERKTLPGREVK